MKSNQKGNSVVGISSVGSGIKPSTGANCNQQLELAVSLGNIQCKLNVSQSLKLMFSWTNKQQGLLEQLIHVAVQSNTISLAAAVLIAALTFLSI